MLNLENPSMVTDAQSGQSTEMTVEIGSEGDMTKSEIIKLSTTGSERS
jgi:hypothetical protein